MDHTSQSTHWSRAADMIQQEANDAKRALTKAEARIAELEGALARLLSARDQIESMRGISARLPDIAEWCWEDARQALATKPQEAEAECPHCRYETCADDPAEPRMRVNSPTCPTHGAKP